MQKKIVLPMTEKETYAQHYGHYGANGKIANSTRKKDNYAKAVQIVNTVMLHARDALKQGEDDSGQKDTDRIRRHERGDKRFKAKD